jgi:hypothetical protein
MVALFQIMGNELSNRRTQISRPYGINECGPMMYVARNSLRRLPFGPRAVNFRCPDRFRQAEEPEDFNLNPGQIEFIPD